MVEDSYHKDRIANRRLHPETLMMGYGYAPGLSEGSLKPPIFLTSTFVFENAQQGKDFFDLTSGRRQPRPGEKSGLVYSRFNNPNLEILEDRLAIWDQAERSAVFASGMAAISTTLFAFLRPSDTVLHSRPLYGGTEMLLKNQMGAFGITAFGFPDGIDVADMRKTAELARTKGRVGLILVETPANPTNGLVDLNACAAIADELEKAQGYRPPVVVDNTMLGPMFQTPLKCGADIALCSLTKYVGGHSDLVGGCISGEFEPRQTGVELAKLHRHAARSEFLLDADALARNARNPYDALKRKRPSGRRIPGKSSQDRQGPLSWFPRGGGSAQDRV